MTCREDWEMKDEYVVMSREEAEAIRSLHTRACENDEIPSNIKSRALAM